jgi:hypothetical protein
MNITKLTYQLHPADVIVAKRRNGVSAILKHYIVYAGNQTFIGNLKNGVKVIPKNELVELLKDYVPIRIKPFKGAHKDRIEAINRAYNDIGRKYSLVNFNCEHFANKVQTGKARSYQVILAFSLIALGLTYVLLKNTRNGKR